MHSIALLAQSYYLLDSGRRARMRDESMDVVHYSCIVKRSGEMNQKNGYKFWVKIRCRMQRMVNECACVIVGQVCSQARFVLRAFYVKKRTTTGI